MKHLIPPAHSLSCFALLTLAFASVQGVSAQTAPLPQGSISGPVQASAGAASTTSAVRARRAELLKNLSPAEIQQLKADLKNIHHDPAFVSAKAAVKEAQTPEAKMEAHKAFAKIRHDLLIKEDPSIQPILDKIHPKAPGTNL